MSYRKAIANGKEKRQEYRGAKAISKRCRNHGGCDWCKENRLYGSLRKTQESIREIELSY